MIFPFFYKENKGYKNFFFLQKKLKKREKRIKPSKDNFLVKIVERLWKNLHPFF